MELVLNNIPHNAKPPNKVTGTKEGVVVEETNRKKPIEEVGIDVCSSEMEVAKESPLGEM